MLIFDQSVTFLYNLLIINMFTQVTLETKVSLSITPFLISRNAFKHRGFTFPLKQNKLFCCCKDAAKLCKRYLLNSKTSCFAIIHDV